MRNRLQIKALSLPGVLLLVLAGLAPAALADVNGSAELLYRNVSVDGSMAKYNEDFNGLNSGMRIGNLDLDWTNPDLKIADYARLSMTGMGGDPYEATTLKLGRSQINLKIFCLLSGLLLFQYHHHKFPLLVFCLLLNQDLFQLYRLWNDGQYS